MKNALPLIFVLALAACGGTGAAWVNEGASKEQVRADQAACRAQAESTIERSESFTRDIRGSTRGGREETRAIVTETRDRRVARSFDQVFGRCMATRGYVHPSS